MKFADGWSPVSYRPADILFKLNVKFKKAIPTTEPELTIKAKVSKQVCYLVYINAEITNSKGELCNEGEAIYFLMNQEKAKEMGFIHCDVEELK